MTSDDCRHRITLRLATPVLIVAAVFVPADHADQAGRADTGLFHNRGADFTIHRKVSADLEQLFLLLREEDSVLAEKKQR